MIMDRQIDDILYVYGRARYVDGSIKIDFDLRGSPTNYQPIEEAIVKVKEAEMLGNIITV